MFSSFNVNTAILPPPEFNKIVTKKLPKITYKKVQKWSQSTLKEGPAVKIIVAPHISPVLAKKINKTDKNRCANSMPEIL
jgi:hypothetical protein